MCVCTQMSWNILQLIYANMSFCDRSKDVLLFRHLHFQFGGRCVMALWVRGNRLRGAEEMGF